jgi:hypothetical protein
VDRSQPPEPLPWEAASHQVVAGDIPSEPPGFQARAVLLAELDRAHAIVPVIQFVTGRPGVGKTMLAAAYARAKLAAGWRLVAWVNAGDAWSLLAGLARTAGAAGLYESGAGWDASDPGQLVRRRLEADGDRCLLVFDDARDPDLLQPFVPAYGAARVLITGPGRSSAIQGTSVPVGVFSGDEAMAFLTARTGRVEAEEAAALAAELGQLPLALAQAASVIAGQSLGYRAYLERLRAMPVEEPLRREVGLPSVPGIAQAVLLSLEAVRAADQTGTCTRVIEILSVLSAAGVRRDLLHAAGQAGALATGGHRVAAALVDEALARLAERSLVTVGLDGQLIIVPRTVMLVVRAEMARRQRLALVCRLTASVLEERAQAPAPSPDRPAIRDIPGQVSALVDNAAGPAGEDKALATVLLRLLATAYWDAMETPSAELIPAAEEVPQAEDFLSAGEVPQGEEVPSAAEVPSAEAAPDAPPEAPGDLASVKSRPEPPPRSDVSSSSRPRRLRVFGLTAAILILVATGGAVTLALSRPHIAGRPTGRSSTPASGPVLSAAGWVSQQVSRSVIVACDPEMCAALEAQGVPAANLVVIRGSTTSLLSAQVVVATPPVQRQFGGRLDNVYAPSIIATFGSGSSRVNVQVVARDGAAAYLAALHQDVAARKAAGAQLLANKQIAVATAARTPLADGEVDSRLLILLPGLAAVHPIQILAFGDPGPGASPGVPWCSADLSSSGRAAGMTNASYLRWLTAFVRAQIGPFAGTIVLLPQGDQHVVRVQFARPSPLGLLTNQ